MTERSMELTAACAKARMTYHSIRDAILRGSLDGWKDDYGRWRVSEASLEQFIATRGKPARAA